MRIITLLSDLGLRDGYAAQMKGVILATCPDALVVDITHNIERHNVAMGSFILETTAPYFPANTIHVAVVDPGVGSDRAAIVIECARALLIGPDNGLMARSSEKLRLESIYQIRDDEFQRKPMADTFHGRDIFAHTAALIASGRKPKEVGPPMSNLKKLELFSPILAGMNLRCQVLHVDIFGNIITNADKELTRKIRENSLAPVEIISRSGLLQARYVRSYYEVDPGGSAVLLGSQGFLEIAIREGSAADKLQVKPLEELELRF
ncbi:MAG TPA: SAM-dependent chlorinase/fluorinase [Candidatus Bathyarchaeia archaeon]|jgi:S-adenosylmethionine hydrolase|nr:SAM-dependent chlorinase/fluorinase [Candidatus Bathyarchaeia archaeon]